jgi:tetratricopeptide (TPR) repeat protein
MRDVSIPALVFLALTAGTAGAAHDPDARLSELEQAGASGAHVHLERGALRAGAGRLTEALAELDVALRLDPELEVVHLARGRALLGAGRREEALAALAAYPSDGERGADASWLRGRALAELGRPVEAERALEEALGRATRRVPEHYLALAAACEAQGVEGARRARAALERGMAELGPVVTLVDAALRVDERLGDREAALARRELRTHLTESARSGAAAARGGPSGPAGPPLLAARAGAGEAVLVPRGATWRYRDDGVHPGSNWTDPTYDDSAWTPGAAQLGYGDGDEATVVSFGTSSQNKHITTWFRREFTAEGVRALTTARLLLLRDDGAVIHLNGVEVARSNMPAGAIGPDTVALAAVTGGSEDAFYTLYFDPSLLADGTNVLAVEVHQRSPGSSDISFDLELVVSDGAPAIVRGPYLQRITPTSAIMRWRTDAPTSTRLWGGPAADALGLAHDDVTLRTEHEVEVSGLSAGRRHYYAVGDQSGVLAGGDGDHWFRTHPAPGSSRPKRVWVIGDSGTANADAAAVRDAYLGYTGDTETDVWLMLGDNAYASGTDAEYQAALFDVYPTLLRTTPPWPTLGNHDAFSASSPSESGAYYDMFTLPRAAEAGGLASGTEAYYSFDHGNVHFVCLDSHDTDRSAGGAMMTWLAADLAATDADWLIAYWHHPPYSKGSHDSDDAGDSGGRMRDMRETALPILEAAGVDLVLTGHSHSYERSFLVDGHHGPSRALADSMLLDRGDGAAGGDGTYAKPTAGLTAGEGVVHAVAGNAGKISGGSLDHPVMAVGINALGSMVLDMDGLTLTARMLDSTGVVRDEFTIEKGVERTLTRDLPSASLATGGTQTLFLDAGPELGGEVYLVVGSVSTSPGFDLDEHHVPLNEDDWLHASLDLFNTSLFQNTFGFLDAQGRAQAAIGIPPFVAPELVGKELYHAFVVWAPGDWYHASNAVKLRLEM